MTRDELMNRIKGKLPHDGTETADVENARTARKIVDDLDLVPAVELLQGFGIRCEVVERCGTRRQLFVSLHKTAMDQTFGSVIRAARLGYFWHDRMRTFIRISADGPPWKVSLCPPDQLPRSIDNCNNHFRVWRDPEIIEMSPVLRAIKQVRRPITLYLNDAGERYAEPKVRVESWPCLGKECPACEEGGGMCKCGVCKSRTWPDVEGVLHMRIEGSTINKPNTR